MVCSAHAPGPSLEATGPCGPQHEPPCSPTRSSTVRGPGPAPRSLQRLAVLELPPAAPAPGLPACPTSPLTAAALCAVAPSGTDAVVAPRGSRCGRVPGPGPDPSPPPKFPNSAVPRLLMLGELCRKPGDFLETAAGWPRTHRTCQTVQSVRAAVTAKEAREGPPGGGKGHGTGAWGRIPKESPEAARGLGFAPDSGPASVALSPPPQEAGPDPATSSWCVV